MNLINNTRNQHFISQAEQRLNASNLSAKPQKQRIYKFKVDNRETSCVSLTNRNGVKICNNLSEQDLFSFDVLDEKKDRYNTKWIDFHGNHILKLYCNVNHLRLIRIH